MIKELTAIVYVPGDEIEFKKYRHNLKNTQYYISKFCDDMKKKFAKAEYINFYYKQSGQFKERIYLQ